MSNDLLKAGDSVFLDSNIFIYHFTNDKAFGASSTALLRRIELGELNGFTSTAILSEVAHRLMTIEACEVFGWPYKGIAQRLRANRDEIGKLIRFRQSIEKIPEMGVRIVSQNANDVLRATVLSQQLGLLSNDALILATMQAQNISILASADADFDQIPDLTRISPS